MMAVRHIDISGYCDTLYMELSGMKKRLSDFVREIDNMEMKEKTVLNTHKRHLNELIDTIDWKLEIFAKSCPIDWSKFGVESEATVSVPTTEKKDLPAGEYSGG